MGWLQPGQATVFPNAFSVTFRDFLQCGQSILKDIGTLPSSYLRPDDSSKWFATQSDSILHCVHAQSFCCEMIARTRFTIP